MHLNEINKKIVKQVFSHPSHTDNVRDSVLSLHEAATKLWVVAATKKDREEIERRVANAFIGACDAAHALGIENVEQIISRRIGELVFQEKIEA